MKENRFSLLFVPLGGSGMESSVKENRLSLLFVPLGGSGMESNMKSYSKSV